LPALRRLAAGRALSDASAGWHPLALLDAQGRCVSVLTRNNVHILGDGEQSMLFAHGYGCDQNMWRYVAAAFEPDYKIVLFDHVGHGRSQPSAFDREKYATLDGFAEYAHLDTAYVNAIIEPVPPGQYI
jgi:pimeloyl-ACP methyl ester carboxylesterase